MKVSSEKTADSQVILTFEAEPQEVQQSLERAYRKMAQRVAIPGFRKGKAPRSLLEQYLGHNALLEEAAQLLIPEATGKAIQEQQLDMIHEPSVELDSLEPVRWRATVPLRPTVDLGQYKDIRMERLAIEVTEEQITQELEELRFNATPWQPVERPVQFGDLVTLNAVGLEGERSILDEKDVQYRPQEGLTNPVPGFAEQLGGMEKGQSKEFDLSFPEEHERKDLAGKAFHFQVTVREVKGKDLPSLDDEFAKGVGDGFESLAQLKEKLAEDIRGRQEVAAKRELQEKAFEELVKMAQVVYPPVLVEHELNHMLEEQWERLRQSRISPEEYVRLTGKNGQQLREELRPLAQERVLRGLVMAQLIEVENIQVSKDEVQSEVGEIATGVGEQADQVRQLFSREENLGSLQRTMLQRKALQRLAEIVSGTPSQGSQG
jgi:trigger factor